MSTTSLKLSPELKERTAAVAEELGISPHAFMVEAIVQATDVAEQRAEFVAQAQAALAEMQNTGLGYDADDVRTYLRERLTNPDAVRPEAKPWRK
jgi:predicted transcriptional regulator